MTEFKPIPLAETLMAELFRLRRLRQRVAELEKELDDLKDIVASRASGRNFTNEQVSQMIGESELLRLALKQRVAELEYKLNTEIGSYASQQIATLTAERHALKQHRDELLAAAEQVCHANNLTEAQIAVRVLNTVIASVKEK